MSEEKQKRQKHKKKGTLYQFEKIGDKGLDLRITQPGDLLDITFIGASWGLLDDLMQTQGKMRDLEGFEAIQPVLDFFDKYVDGGKSAVPIDHGFSLFRAIAEYMRQSSVAQKN